MFNRLLRVKDWFYFHVECDWEFNLIQIGVSSRGEISKYLYFVLVNICWTNTIRQSSLKIVQKLTEIFILSWLHKCVQIKCGCVS
jgi:hypothetical protein